MQLDSSISNKAKRRIPVVSESDSDSDGDVEKSEQKVRTSLDATDEPVFNALRAAARGNLEAQEFVIREYSRGNVSARMGSLVVTYLESIGLINHDDDG